LRQRLPRQPGGFEGCGCPKSQQGLDGAGGVAVSPDGASVYVVSYVDDAIVRFDREALRCRGQRATQVGTAIADTITGTPGRDVIVAQGGNDRIDTLGGNDWVCSGPGNDTVFTRNGVDRAYGEGGVDRIRSRLTSGVLLPTSPIPPARRLRGPPPCS
jgi:Ca2+-binding RTX toxin-like protein